MNAQGLIGVVVLVGLAVLFSTDRRRINWRLVIIGLLLQFAIAAMALRVPLFLTLFDAGATAVTRVISFADEGSRFLFGRLADSSPAQPWGFIFAVRVLPVIVFFAAFMAVLYHLGVMQRVVAALAWVLRRTMGISGVEALSASANIFLGQTEAPLTVKPYIAGMTRSQIMAIMVPGFASIAGSVLAAYVNVLGGTDEASRILFAKHLLAASIMSAPAGLVMAKLMLPETELQRDESLPSLVEDKPQTRNVMDAAAAGATDGLALALNVAAMLVAFVALLAMVNYPLSALSDWAPIAQWRANYGIPVFSIQNILGLILTPIAWCMGVRWQDCQPFGALLGQAVVATEFVAYLDLGRSVQEGTLSPRTTQIATYALCGFANLPSIAIQIGGLSAMVPSRRSEFAAIAPRAMVAGALACWMTGAMAGVFIG